jgi:tryptophan-rich sensory protein
MTEGQRDWLYRGLFVAALAALALFVSRMSPEQQQSPLLGLLGVYLVVAIICARVAQSKNRNPVAWFLLSLILGPIAWLALAMVGGYRRA